MGSHRKSKVVNNGRFICMSDVNKIKVEDFATLILILAELPS